MKILHFHPDGNKMISDYAALLCRVMGEYAEVSIVTGIPTLTKQIKQRQPDIIHLHGCWNMQTSIAARMARRKGIRTVLTPHGQLEPWIIKQNYLKEKLPRMLLYQKSIVRQAYAVIVMGRMEEHHFKQLKWNPRVEIAHNSIITETITEDEMCHTIYGIYDKVMHTDVIKLMNMETITAMAALIKAGLTGNHLWLNDHEYSIFREPNNIEWEKLAIYAYQDGIATVITKGIDTLGLPKPDIIPADIPYYLPKSFVQPQPLHSSVANYKSESKETADSDSGSTIFTDKDTYHFTEIIKQASKLASRRQLTISHIVEIAETLRTRNIDEAKAADTLKTKGLYKFAGRMMTILSDMTGMEEGFMPVSPINDRQTKRIKTIITKHLEI